MRRGRQKLWKEIGLAAFALGFAAACSNGPPQSPSSSAPLAGNKEEILGSYVLLGSTGSLGAHLNFTNQQQCSITHLAKDIVVGAGHCGQGEDQWVVYQDRFGQQQMSPLMRPLYVQNSSRTDAFVGQLYPADAEAWPAAYSDGLAHLRRYTPSEIQSESSIPERVYIIAGDPLTAHPELVEKYGPYGFVYNPAVSCEGVRKVPRLASTGTNGEPADPVALAARGKQLDAKFQVFAQCRGRENGPGQSGGGMFNAALQYIGPFTWQLRRGEQFGADEQLERPNGSWEKVAEVSGSPTVSLIEFGTAIESVLDEHPELAPAFQWGGAALSSVPVR
jgi:hypothetical protein